MAESGDGVLDEARDQHLDLFGREARCFGLDGDLRRDEVWEHVEPGMSRDMDTVSK